MTFEILFQVFAFVLGASIGSFLNVCIYRMPRDLSVNEPRRSFCPACRAPIPWHRNIPLLSWLLLRGRCASCGAPIAFRYFLVELLTGLLFLAAWMAFPPAVAICYWVFLALVLVATFVDFEHFIIPDEISLGGAAAGVVASLLVPELMRQTDRLAALGHSLGAAVLGYFLLWGVLEAGKLVFGKKRIRLDAPVPFSWIREGQDARFAVGEETGLWSDHFSRESDVMTMQCDRVMLDARDLGAATLRLRYDRLFVAGDEFALDQVNRITGTVRELQIPREAMGRGDLKFLACIGAFLGWRAVLFSVFAGSLLGSVLGLAALLSGGRAWSTKLPFGPYLAAGALIWMFFGDALVEWYLALLYPADL